MCVCVSHNDIHRSCIVHHIVYLYPGCLLHSVSVSHTFRETTDKVEEVSNCEVDSRIQRGEEKQVDPQDEVKPPPPKPVQPTVPQPIIWQRAKQELVMHNYYS